jgi:Peptidase family S41
VADPHPPASDGSTSLKDFREWAERRDRLTVAEMGQIVETARVLLTDFYVYLDLKWAMIGADPLERLHLLEQRLDLMPARRFHDEMLSIFTELRDRHTIYYVPEPYRGLHAELPIRVQACGAPGKRSYIVTEIDEALTPASLVRGAEVVAFDGVPIDRAIELDAQLRGGATPDAYLARGLSFLTDRPLTFSPLPEHDTAVVEYRTREGDETDTAELEWRVQQPDDTPGGARRDEPHAELAYVLGVDRVAESVRRAQKTRFRPDAVKVETAERREDPPDRIPHIGDGATSQGLEGPSADRLQYAQADSRIGYLRIRSFDVEDVTGFVFDVIRVIGWLDARDGLIIDIRGNGGGAIAAGERLLQLFRPRDVAPQLIHFSATDGTRRIAATSAAAEQWRPSLELAEQTGAEVSDELPLSASHVESCNEIGQRYDGPVVVIVDATTYSTAELFAAGIQDHGIGTILGTDRATGGGGGNPWSMGTLQTWWPKEWPWLPKGSSFDVAVRATTRVERNAGRPVEGLGVKPSAVHHLTLRDLVEHNQDLIATAIAHLAAQRDGRLEVTAKRLDDTTAVVSVEADGLAEVDVYVNDRPAVARRRVGDGVQDIEIDVVPDRRQVLLVRGYDKSGTLAVSRRTRLARRRTAVAADHDDEERTMPDDETYDEDGKEIAARVERHINEAIATMRSGLEELLEHEQQREDRIEVTRRIEDALYSIQRLDDLATNRWRDSATNRWFGGY